MRESVFAAGAILAALLPLPVAAQPANSGIETVEVTATRLPEPVGDVPADVSLVGGDELLARQAHNLATALALVPGVEAPSGGDAGPSSAVPSFWGLHEFDAFLLVVDGVPWGGAFNPAIPDLDFNDVQRIEVLKGSAPVAYGNYDSWRAAGSVALPDWGGFRQSLAADSEQLGFADQRESVKDTHLL